MSDQQCKNAIEEQATETHFFMTTKSESWTLPDLLITSSYFV